MEEQAGHVWCPDGGTRLNWVWREGRKDAFAGGRRLIEVVGKCAPSVVVVVFSRSREKNGGQVQ